MHKRWFWWLVVVALGIAIYQFTDSPLSNNAHTIKILERLGFLSTQHITILSYIVRKLAHLLNYALLAFALRNALFPYRWTYPAAWLLTTLYGAGDEIHQMFVPGRTPLLSDVMIDSLGAFLALSALYHLTLRRGKKPLN